MSLQGRSFVYIIWCTVDIIVEICMPNMILVSLILIQYMMGSDCRGECDGSGATPPTY